MRFLRVPGRREGAAEPTPPALRRWRPRVPVPASSWDVRGEASCPRGLSRPPVLFLFLPFYL